MLKKKNIAMVMAAATVATSVAPVFAAEVKEQDVDKAALIKAVGEKLAVKYTDSKVSGEDGGKDDVTSKDAYRNSVYKVEASAEGVVLEEGKGAGAAVVVESVAHLERLIEKAEVKDKAIKVVITDKGHKTTADGKIVSTFKGEKYADQNELDKQFEITKENTIREAKNDPIKVNNQEVASVKVDLTDDNKKVEKVTLTFKDDKSTKIILTENSKKLDFKIPLNEGKGEIEPSTIVGEETAKTVVGFKELDGVYGIDGLTNEFSTEKKVNVKSVIDEITNGKIGDAKKVIAKVEKKDSNYEITFEAKDEDKKNIKSIITKDSAKINFDMGLDKNGKEVKISEISTKEDAEKVVGFALQSGNQDLDIKSEKVSELRYRANSGKLVELDFSSLKTDNGYTETAKELTELLKLADGSNSSKVITTVKDGKAYQIKFAFDKNLRIESYNDASGKHEGYKLIIDLTAAETGKTLPESENVHLVIKSKVQKDLADFKKLILDKEVVSTSEYKTLAGNSRFDTAIEISKEGFVGTKEALVAGKDQAKAIVLVGENAVVDGLASAPLANQEKAPILLTKKDSVPTETMNEIKRLVEKGAKIYLVGGENTISKTVEAQLAKEMNAEIVRLSGKDRYETSLKIAKAITTKTDAFVVGGNGLADAMSIASVAAQKSAPIIVTPKEGLTEDAKGFLKDVTKNFTNIDVIGGVNSVSTQVLKDINKIRPALDTVDRIAGNDRNDTNAKVIKEYFTSNSDLNKVYVAKDGDSQLVDALAVAPLAGKTKGAIVLATNDLTKAQADILEAKKANQKVTQIGGGIASTVVQKVLKALTK